jgi:hypothetical protein
MLDIVRIVRVSLLIDLSKPFVELPEIPAPVPTVNPKRLSITCESVDNHLRWVISSS